MIPTSFPYLCVHKFRGRIIYKLDALRLIPFLSLSCVQQSHCMENGVPGVKHHTWQKSIWCPHVVFLNQYHHVDFILIFICFLHALYRLNSLEQQFAFYHMYAYIQGKLNLYNVRVKFCDLFHSTHKGSQSLTLPCATNVFLFGVLMPKGENLKDQRQALS